ncbi:MAG: hypothetical protein R3F33_14380 [Planctomycetota bacterium]
MPNVEVSAWWVPTPAESRGVLVAEPLGTVSPDGAFQFEVPGEQAGRILLFARDHAPLSSDLQAGEGAQDLLFSMQPGTSIDGHAVLPEGATSGIVRCQVEVPLTDVHLPGKQVDLDWGPEGIRLASQEVRVDATGVFRFVGLLPAAYRLALVPQPHIPSHQVEAVAGWNDGQAFDAARLHVLDFSGAALAVVAPSSGLELQTTVQYVNVFCIAEEHLRGDLKVKDPARPNVTYTTPGAFACWIAPGADPTVLLEHDGYLPRSLRIMEALDPALGAAVVYLERNPEIKRVWLNPAGPIPANLQVLCVANPNELITTLPVPTTPRMQGRYEVFDRTRGSGRIVVRSADPTRSSTDWYVPWSMSCAELQNDQVIPLQMQVGGRIRVFLPVEPAPNQNIMIRQAGEAWQSGGAWSISQSQRTCATCLPPGVWEVAVGNGFGSRFEPLVNGSIEVVAQEIAEITLTLP